MLGNNPKTRTNQLRYLFVKAGKAEQLGKREVYRTKNGTELCRTVAAVY
jgi:hypothetical protein